MQEYNSFASLNIANNRSRQRNRHSTTTKKCIAGTKHQIDKHFPARTYRQLKHTLIRMKDRKYFVQECIICLESIQNQTMCRMLSCFHIFHSKCIEAWLTQTSSCPMCN